ncbi:hypothetical protein SARC_13576, partial [Sphaeroforma arctica JP610]
MVVMRVYGCYVLVVYMITKRVHSCYVSWDTFGIPYLSDAFYHPELKAKELSVNVTVAQWIRVVGFRVQGYRTAITDYTSHVIPIISTTRYYNNIAGYNEIPKYDLPNTEHKNTLGNSLALLKEMKAHKLMSTTQTDLVMDYCPYLLHLTAPKVHGSRVGFMSANDRGLVDNLVHVLVDYGLDFLPFRNETGSFVYELQP